MIFGFVFWQDAATGQPTPTLRKTAQLYGLYNQVSTEGSPDIDPGQQPGSDWIWAGIIPAHVINLRWTSDAEYRVQFESPAGQLETQSRRRNTSPGSNRVWLLTDTLTSLESDLTEWGGVAYFSLLYSTPS